MSRFEEFIKKGEVRKATKDISLAKSLKEFSEIRISIALKMPLNEQSATVVYEIVYDALRELIDSLLALEGYKSYSHIASIYYLERFPQINQLDLAKLDNIREKRNLSKYYAKPTTVQETKDLMDFYNKIKPRLLEIYNILTK